jgi:hypothetical protein
MCDHVKKEKRHSNRDTVGLSDDYPGVTLYIQSEWVTVRWGCLAGAGVKIGDCEDCKI